TQDGEAVEGRLPVDAGRQLHDAAVVPRPDGRGQGHAAERKGTEDVAEEVALSERFLRVSLFPGGLSDFSTCPAGRDGDVIAAEACLYRIRGHQRSRRQGDEDLSEILCQGQCREVGRVTW